MKKLLSIALLLLLICTTSFADELQEKAVEYIGEVAFGNKDSSVDMDTAVLKRIHGSIHISLQGNVTSKDMTFIDALLYNMDRKTNIDVSLEYDYYKANVVIYYGDAEFHKKYVRNYREGESFYWYYWDDFSNIYHADIAVLDSLDQETRNANVVRLLFRSIGMSYLSSGTKSSVLNKEMQNLTKPSDLDWKALELIYSKNAHAGMTYEAFKKAISENMN